MKKKISFMIIKTLTITLVYAQYNPVTKIESYLLSFIALQQGKSFERNSDQNIVIKEQSKLLDMDIIKFSFINTYEVKQDLLSGILYDNKLYKDKLLMDKLENSSRDEKMALIDSLLTRYQLTTDTDSLLVIYRRKYGNTLLNQNKRLSWNTAIAVYCETSDQYYMLCGFKHNDFKSFFYQELQKRLNLRTYTKSLIKDKLSSLTTSDLDLVDFYSYYIEKNSCNERYPIRYYFGYR